MNIIVNALFEFIVTLNLLRSVHWHTDRRESSSAEKTELAAQFPEKLQD
jgi:hypothetical protein